MKNTLFLATLMAFLFSPFQTLFAQPGGGCNPDVTPPTVVCINGLSINIMQTGFVDVWATDFLQYAEDNCTIGTDIELGICKLDAQGNQVAPPELSITYNTTEVGQRMVRLYAKDAAGNQSWCETIIIVGNPFAPALSIEGRVFADQTQNCQYDSGEPYVGGVLVLAETFPTHNEFFVFTNATSPFSGLGVLLNPNDTLVRVRIFDDTNINIGCTNVYDIPVNGTSASAFLDFPLRLKDCPSLQVQISGPPPRPCFDRAYFVDYYNQGLQPIGGAYVEVKMDPDMALLNSSLPAIPIGNNTYRFDIGNVDALGAGAFSISYILDCNAQMGQVFCTEATIFPDTICDPMGQWTGARVLATADCTGNQALLKLQNIGNAATSAGLGFILTEDVIMYRQEDFQLNPGGTLQFPMPANGATWHISAEQEPGYPGGQYTNASLEGCGTNNQGGITTGVFLQQPYSNGQANSDVACMEAVNSYDPNDKQGFPTGVGANNKIRPGTEINYQIRFQNTGNDVAYKVVVKEQLPAGLDPGSVRVGASSHPYVFKMHSDGLMEFIFDNINLPDSNANLAGSQGFLTYKATPKLDLPLGTVIAGEANIYFDFNPPITTNTCFHTVDEDFLISAVKTVLDPMLQLSVFPNPTTEFVVLQIDNPQNKEWSVELTDALGRTLRTVHGKGNNLRLDCNHLPAGSYFFAVKTAGALVATGQVVVR